MPPRRLLGSAFQSLVDLPAAQSAGIMLAALVAIVLVFFAAYAGPLRSSFSKGGREADADAACLLWYSVGLTTTLADAPCSPTDGAALLVANLHAIIVQLALVYVTGVVFTRMSKPGLTMTLADKILFNDDDEHLGRVLKTRLFFNGIGDQLIDVSFELMFVRKLTPTFMKSDNLALTRCSAPLLKIGTQITHRITQEGDGSPLYGETMASLEERNAKFVLTVLGTELSTMQTVFFSQSYAVRDGTVVDGERFTYRNMGEMQEGVGRVFNFANASVVEPRGTAGKALEFD